MSEQSSQLEPMDFRTLLNAVKEFIWNTSSGAIPGHEEMVARYNDALLKQPLGKPGIQNNPYDRAKNYSGGYDWGYRVGDLKNVHDLGLAYQLWEDSDNRMNEINDLHQNMIGAAEGVKDKKLGKRKSFEEVLELSKKYGLQK